MIMENYVVIKNVRKNEYVISFGSKKNATIYSKNKEKATKWKKKEAANNVLRSFFKSKLANKTGVKINDFVLESYNLEEDILFDFENTPSISRCFNEGNEDIVDENVVTDEMYIHKEYSMSNEIKLIYDALKNIEELKKVINDENDIRNKITSLDRATSDALHLIELKKMDAVNMCAFGKKLKNIREERRNLKDLLAIIESIKNIDFTKISKISQTISSYSNRRYLLREDDFKDFV